MMSTENNSVIDSLPFGHPARDPQNMAQILTLARTTAAKAHAPYSRFHVGSALMTCDGQIYAGCNTETAMNEGLICGERNAIFNAVTEGAAKNNPRFIDILVCACVDAPADGSISDSSPCGACRQVINEFAHADTIVVVDDKKNGVLFRASDLLPGGFRFGPEQSRERVAIAPIPAIEEAVKNSSLSAEQLIELAKKASINSYTEPGWGPGAAIIITDNGDAIAGVRVGNSSTGLSANPDRVAIGRAVARGILKDHQYSEDDPPQFIHTIVMYLDTDDEPTPRLVNQELLYEFGHRGTKIIIATNSDKVLTMTFGDIMKLGQQDNLAAECRPT